MAMNEDNHMLDLNLFIQEESENIWDYFQVNTNDSYSQENTNDSNFQEDFNELNYQENFKNWIEEQILLLFSQWATGITKTILRQDILKKARTSRSRQHVKPDANHHPVLHGKITGVEIIKHHDRTISSAIISIKQERYDLIIKAALHGALLPYVDTFITGGRIIHFANIRFSNDCLIPNQLCVIDLLKTKEDINFIKRCPPFPINKITEQNCPESLLLQVESPTREGIRMSDCTNSIELLLDEERMSLKQLLNFGDIILFVNPWAIESDNGQVYLTYGPNSVLFRVPIKIDSKAAHQSQFSQHSSLTQDGLSLRNSVDCRTLRGTVLSMSNQFDDRSDLDISQWTSSVLKIQTTENTRATIKIRVSTDTSYEVMRVVASLKPNHFVCIFGLIQEDLYTYSFTSETTIYNTSQLYSIISSNIVLPQSLSISGNYKTFVAKAVITKVLTCDIKYKHKICSTLLRSKQNITCPICQAEITNPKDVDDEFIFKIEIDDMSCDPITVYGNGSKFAIWSTKPIEWIRADQRKKDRLLFPFIGREFIFVLSKASQQEFCGFGDDYCEWRIDQCIRPGDIEREVRRLTKLHNQLDKEEDLSQNSHYF